MGETVITEYTYDASEKKITITQSGYTTITIEQIKYIFNATRGTWLYNPEIRKYGPQTGTAWNKYYPLSSVADAVITYTAPNADGSADTDKLLITISTDELTGELTIDDSTPVDINVTNLTSIPVAVDPLPPVVIDDATPVDVNITNIAIIGNSDLLTVYSSQSVTASTTINSTAQDIRNVSHAVIFIKNATSTSLTVNIYGSPDSAGTFRSLAGTTTLNTTTDQDELTLSHCPNYLFFDVINSDSSNAATVDIAVQRTVLSDVVRPYSDVLEVYSSASVTASSTTSSAGQDIRGASYVIPYIKNAVSTDLTVNVYGSYDLAGTIKTLIRSYALNVVTDEAGDPITKCPNYLFFDLVNGDSSNAATVNVAVMRR